MMGATYQYRVTIGTTQRILDALPDSWGLTAEQAEERGMVATLDRRAVFADDSILPLLVNPSGWLRLGRRVVSPWQTIAQIN